MTITFRSDVLCPDAGIAHIEEYLADVEAHAGNPIGWVIAEEFGSLNGRWHCHGLVCGTSHLHRRFWWSEAFRRFGRSRIDPFEPGRAAAFYTAKYAAKTLGRIHFGGSLGGSALSCVVRDQAGRRAWENPHAASSPGVATHGLIARSAEIVEWCDKHGEISSECFKLTLGRRHR